MYKKVLLLIMCLLLSACPAEEKSGSRARRVPVNAEKVLIEKVQNTLQVVGHVEPSASVQVGSQVGGQLIQAFVKPGHYVREGELLFKIDPRGFKTRVDEAEAVLRKNQSLLKKAKHDMARYKALAAKDFLSQQQYEQSATEVETLLASITQAESLLEHARLQLEYTDITAPVSGRVGDLLVDPGNIVKANDTALLVINTIAPADVRFAVPEKYLPELNRRVKVGTVSVKVLPEGDSGDMVPGILTVIDNEVDRNTGTVNMRARFSNQDERLWPGQFVRVSIVMDYIDNALVIPFSAVLEGVAGQYVYVVRVDNTVEERPVKTLLLEDRRLQVIFGLEGTETVVTDGQLNLYPGAKIILKQDEQAFTPDNQETTESATASVQVGTSTKQ